MEITKAYFGLHDSPLSECSGQYTYQQIGHAESYSYSLDLETALATALGETSSVLAPYVVCNSSGPSLLHSDFDNCDQYIDDISRSWSVHTSHGNMMQNIQNGQAVSDPFAKDWKEVLIDITKPDSLPSCSISQRNSPQMIIIRLFVSGSEDTFSKSKMVNLS